MYSRKMYVVTSGTGSPATDTVAGRRAVRCEFKAVKGGGLAAVRTWVAWGRPHHARLPHHARGRGEGSVWAGRAGGWGTHETCEGATGMR